MGIFGIVLGLVQIVVGVVLGLIGQGLETPALVVGIGAIIALTGLGAYTAGLVLVFARMQVNDLANSGENLMAQRERIIPQKSSTQ